MDARTATGRALLGLALLAAWDGYTPPRARAAEEPADPRVAAALDEARRTATDLTETLGGLLRQELQRGGYEGALRVCAEQAPLAARRFREQSGRDVRRVSLRPRNAANAPDAFERGVLEQFERRHAAGEPPGEHIEVLSGAGRPALRYLRPLPVSALCLNCHGRPEDIPPAVGALLKEKYPDDLATGYRTGDVRGAVSVTIVLPAPGPAK